MKTDLIRNLTAEFDRKSDDRIFLTVDLDWCSDEVFGTTLDILEKYDAYATIFVTHDTALLDRVRENPKLDLGIHPNFNFLLEGDHRYGRNHRDVIKHFLSIVPDAVSVRSHSLVQSSGILQTFFELGLTHDCNLLLPVAMKPVPFEHWNNGLLRVPYIFEDDVECHIGWKNLGAFGAIDALDCVKVFNWHPIHIFLNTEHLDRYKNSSAVHRRHELLKDHVNQGSFGARDLLLQVLGQCA